ncbi:hypothetical protein ACFYUD_31815 [Nocardia tengchongensis]|uniref:hypothetical protein n=1 Tax=Nocardia tengchongensis TaxID=2055889 RepID=UPI0036A7202B
MLTQRDQAHPKEVRLHYSLTVRLLLVIIAILAAAIVGLLAGGLAQVGSHSWLRSIATGGAAFSATLTMASMVLSNLGAFS